jgi:phytanoyl-CoA hydroxylase
MLTIQQRAQFEDQGFVVAKLFNDEDLAFLISQLHMSLQRRAFEVLGTKDAVDVTSQPPLVAMKIVEAMENRDNCRTEFVFSFLRHPKLLDCIETLLGPEILCHPTYNIHPRLPTEYTVPHQDAAYLLPDGDQSRIVACIVPLVNTSIENGCLWVIPGGHRGGVLPHVVCRHGDSHSLELPEAYAPRQSRVPVPLEKGSVAVINHFLPHGSFVNRTSQIRWSVDVRYQPDGEPTGRWFAPPFIARSRSNPSREMKNYLTWIAEAARVSAEADMQVDRARYRWDELPSDITNVARVCAPTSDADSADLLND